MLDEIGDKSQEYSFQLVVSTGDVKALTDANREQELEYYKQHRLDIVEQIVAHAEEYPTQEEKEAFDARIEALTVLTAEEEEALGDIPYLEVDQAIKPTEISDYPSWGAYDKNTQSFVWQ